MERSGENPFEIVVVSYYKDFFAVGKEFLRAKRKKPAEALGVRKIAESNGNAGLKFLKMGKRRRFRDFLKGEKAALAEIFRNDKNGVDEKLFESPKRLSGIF